MHGEPKEPLQWCWETQAIRSKELRAPSVTQQTGQQDSKEVILLTYFVSISQYWALHFHKKTNFDSTHRGKIPFFWLPLSCKQFSTWTETEPWSLGKIEKIPSEVSCLVSISLSLTQKRQGHYFLEWEAAYIDHTIIE